MTGQHLLVQNISHGKEKPFGSGLARSLWVSLALQVQKHKAAILEVLQRGLENTTCPVVAAESMLALAEVVRKLKAEGLGSAFKDIARSTKMFFEAVSEITFSCLSERQWGGLGPPHAAGRVSAGGMSALSIFPHCCAGRVGCAVKRPCFPQDNRVSHVPLWFLGL